MKTRLVCLLVLLFLPGGSSAQEVSDKARAGNGRLYKWSLAASAAANTLDILSSYGKHELNPILAGADQRFNTASAVRKAGIVGGLDLLQLYMVRRNPRAMRAATIMNFVLAGVLSGIAAHNYSIPVRQDLPRQESLQNRR